MSTDYDAIVVGARCGGSPTAMLLARNGYRVLLVDKATFPSDTMSTHLAHPPAVAALDRWGILEQLEATNCPPITRYSFDFGPVAVAGTPRPSNGTAKAYCPRRIVLDALLVEAAAAAGAEVREAFTVEEIAGRRRACDGHPRPRQGRRHGDRAARVVVGADGRHSLVAKAVQPEQYNEVPPLAPAYYAYWSGLPADGFETYIRAEAGRGWAAIPTHDGLTCVVQGWPQAEFEANRKDVEGTYLEGLRARARVRRAHQRREAGDAVSWARETCAGLLPQAVRARVGARRRRRLPQAPDHGVRDHGRVPRRRGGGVRPRRDLRRAPLVRRRDGRLPARPGRGGAAHLRVHLRLREARAASARDAAAHRGDAGQPGGEDDFVSVMAGTLPAPEFFAPENAGRIMAAAGAPPG